MNVLVFDIETVPDVEAGRNLHGLNGLADADVANVMFSMRSQETEGRTEFIRHHLQQVVAISVVLRTTDDKLSIWSLGDADSPEPELIQRFFDGIERYSPNLVSWNGRGFDLPVLHYRSLRHCISAARYWETGDEDRAFRWNNYLNRFHERHIDLMDVLAGYDARGFAPLHEVATLLGFPGKFGLSGGDVWGQFQAGDIGSIRDYCETDVLNTYLIYLRYELMRGWRTQDGYDRGITQVRELLQQEDKPHFQAFSEAWRQ